MKNKASAIRLTKNREDISANNFSRKANRSPYVLKSFPWSSHSLIAGILKQKQAQTILDVGCDEGFLGSSLQYQPKKLWGIDKRKLPQLPKYSKICLEDLETTNFGFLKGQKFQAIVLADILEHLKEPAKVTEKLKLFLDEDGFFVISVPNMEFFLARLLIFLRVRPKMDNGLFDKTHLHDFTLSSLKQLLNQNHLSIQEKKFTPAPLPVISNWFNESRALFIFFRLANQLAIKFPMLFGYQIIVVTKQS